MNISPYCAFSFLAATVCAACAGSVVQLAKINSSSPSNYENYGSAVAISGGTIVVGVREENSSSTGINSTHNELGAGSGAVYVYVKSGSSWIEQAYIKADNAGESDHFGESVAIDGDTIVVGAPDEDGDSGQITNNAGAVYVFKRTGTTWAQQAYLKASNGAGGAQFGFSVDIAGETIVAGSPGESGSAKVVNGENLTTVADAGAGYVFVRNGEAWTQQAYLKSTVTNLHHRLGYSVGIDGNTIALGAWGEDSDTSGINPTANNRSTASGAVFVFERSGTTWAQQAFLKADPSGGVDRLGESVAISGNTVLAGAYNEDSDTTGVNSTPNNNAQDSGAAYVFVRNGTTWSQQAYLKASNTGTGDIFGRYLDIDGDLIAIGSYHEDSSTTGINSEPNELLYQAGAVYTFTRLGESWTQKDYIKPDQIGLVHEFGNAVGVDGQTVVAAAHFAFEPGGTNGSFARYGAVYVFGEVTGLLAWKQFHFGSTSDTGPSANDEDFDQDGIRNLVEYGIGSSPTITTDPNTFLGVKKYGGSDFLRCTYARDPSRTDVNLRVQVSVSPVGPWTTIATCLSGGITTGTATITETATTGGRFQVDVRDLVALPNDSQPDRFMRLVAE